VAVPHRVFCSEYLANTTFIEDIYKLFDSLNSVSCAVTAKELRNPVSGNSLDIGHWAKSSTRISSWIFLKDGKPAFKQPALSQIRWLTYIAAALQCRGP
jgi:hypothetical protein